MKEESPLKQWIVCALLALIAARLVSAQQPSPNDKTIDPYRPTMDRLESLSNLPLSDWRFHTDVPHPEDSSLDDSGWGTIKVGDKLSTGSRVLRRSIEIPEKINGYAVLGARAKLDLRFDFMWNNKGPVMISVFSNGALVSRGDDDMQQPIPLTNNAQPGQKFLIAVRIDAPEIETRIHHAQLSIEPGASQPDPAMIRMEILAARPMIAAYEEGRAERQQQLDAAVKAIDFSLLDKDDQAGFDASLRQAQTKLQLLNSWLKQFTVRAVGNSHIDMAWLWPWTETVEVVRNTFQSVLDLMREYPDFKFTMSSARTYEWMQEKYPDLYKQIEQRVKEGRWEIIGGMWVEPDLNMPAGESLVRQILVGKRYFQKNFGVDVKIGWNPDSFGYNWQLPQIYKKSGMDYFVTQKLLWAHEFTTFPYKLFWWQAPDGSRLLTYFPHDYAGGIDADSLGTDLSIWMPSIYGKKLTDNPEMMHLYGVGDHGGGPTRVMLDHAEQLMSKDAVYPKLEFSFARTFFSDLEKKLPSMQVPTWNGELYFAYHRGVFTTQAETKRRIRRAEESMLNAEMFASLATRYGRPYPQDDMELAWKRLLFDHFHDIMPGSGIAVNYLDAKRNLENVTRVADGILRRSLEEILAHANTDGPGVPIAVFNSLSWPRTEVIEVTVQFPGMAPEVWVVDAQDKAVPSRMFSLDARTHRARLLFQAAVPAL